MVEEVVLTLESVVVEVGNSAFHMEFEAIYTSTTYIYLRLKDADLPVVVADRAIGVGRTGIVVLREAQELRMADPCVEGCLI